MLTARCSHLYWGQSGPCSAEQWALGSDERQEREPEQSREECGVTRAHSADPHTHQATGPWVTVQSFQKQTTNTSRTQDLIIKIILNLVEMNQATDAWSLRPHSDLGLAWTVEWPAQLSMSSQAPAQVSLSPVATTLHTDTARNGSPATSSVTRDDKTVYFVNRNLRGLWRWTGLMP